MIVRPTLISAEGEELVRFRPDEQSGMIAHPALSATAIVRAAAVQPAKHFRRLAFRPDSSERMVHRSCTAAVATYSTAWCCAAHLGTSNHTRAAAWYVLRVPASISFSATHSCEACDLCLVGAGTIGAIIARDTASCSHSVVVLEMEPVIGGV